MTKPTRDELKDLLRDSHQRDRRDPVERAKGLDALLAAADAPAPVAPQAGGKKVVAGVAVTVIAVGLAAWWLKPAPDEVRPVVVDAGVPQLVAPPVVAPPVVVEVVDAGVTAVEPVDASVPAVVVVPARPKVIEEDETPDSLARELTLLDSARKELQTSPASALSTLTTYEREFPRGSMRTEAALVRVEVLMRLNRRTEAEKLARSLIAADRDGLVKRRVSKLLDAGVP